MYCFPQHIRYEAQNMCEAIENIMISEQNSDRIERVMSQDPRPKSKVQKKSKTGLKLKLELIQ